MVDQFCMACFQLNIKMVDKQPVVNEKLISKSHYQMQGPGKI